MTKDQGLDIDKILNILRKNGHEFQVVSIEEIINKFQYYKNVEDSYIIYSGSKNIEYNTYIDHIVYILSKKNYVIPNYDVFKAYDDKGFQELLKDKLGLHSLNYKYHSSLNSFLKFENDIRYPIIIKEMKSASSKGVYKAQNREEAVKIINHICRGDLKTNFTLLKNFIKRMVNKNINEMDYKGIKRFLVQEFVQNLDSDWKVLVFGDKYYCLKRSVRPNDFRASGSGLFEFDVPPEIILKFAQNTFEKMNVPFISLDLAVDEQGVYIIELQGLNFGPITLVNSPHYFTLDNNEWIKIERESDLDEEYANAYLYYIRNNNK